jgi:hypothetical protein
MFPERTARPVPATPVLVVELTLAVDTPQDVWLVFLVSRDLSFLAW